MTALKTNINHYMEMKNIKKYSHLLADIARELGIKGQKANEFAKREKSNFSKMLNGKRPLKYEYIIPLEKIFGVSLARLMDEDAYKLPVERENVAFDKGFRYYACKDDPELYEREFDNLLNTEGKTILNNTDEFGKNFLDYIVEYESVNGVKYLYENYKPRMKGGCNQFEFDKDKGYIFLQIKNVMPFARLIARMQDTDMFYTMFDSYNMFFTNGHYGNETGLFNTGEYLELLMDNENLFKALFDVKEYKRVLGDYEKRKLGKDSITHSTVNPILNNCLKHALQHLPKYKNQAIAILQFGINHNQHVAEKHDMYHCFVNEMGRVEDDKDQSYYELVIMTDEKNSRDEEIDALIKQLPKFKTWC